MAEKSQKGGNAPSGCREKGDWPVFPVEIFEDIIQCVVLLGEEETEEIDIYSSYDDEPEPTNTAVKKLSLVCWTFVRLCRPYIWESIKISFESGRPRPSLKKLENFVKKSPVLATYVKRVAFTFESGFDKASTVPGLPVLFKLPNVKEFHILEDQSNPQDWTLYYGRGDQDLAWRTIFDHFITLNLSKITLSNMWDPPLVKLFSMSSLETLELRRCRMSGKTPILEKDIGPNGFNLKCFIGSDLKNFPLSLLNFCPSLEELDLVSVDASEETDDFASRSRSLKSFGRLRKFTSQGYLDYLAITMLADLAGLSYFPSLKEISIRLLSPGEVPRLPVLFKYCRSLEKVFLENSRNCTPDYHTAVREFIVACKPTLKDLWLEWGAESLHEAEKVTKELGDTLALIKGNNVLEELTTGIDFQCRDVELIQPRSIKQWQRLDKMLLDNDGADFPHLREVVFTLEPFVYETGRKAPDSQLKRFFDEPFKNLLSTQRFDFKTAINLHRMGNVGQYS